MTWKHSIKALVARRHAGRNRYHPLNDTLAAGAVMGLEILHPHDFVKPLCHHHGDWTSGRGAQHGLFGRSRLLGYSGRSTDSSCDQWFPGPAVLPC